MTPRRPAETPRRRHDTRPSLLSPSSGSAFSATADGDNDAAASEPPSVMLLEWWLANVEGDDQKIAVAGTFRANQILYELSPAPIAECHAPNILETEDGTILLISGSLDNMRTLGNGYSDAVCKHFMVGFPFWWQSCNMRYPKLTNSDTPSCQPGSSNTTNSGVEHLDSYRTSSISKHPDGLRRSSHNDSVFPKSSHLANGTPRFEQHTCDGDSATNQNAVASSEAGKGGQRTPVVTLEVQGCREDTQHMALTEKAAVDEEMRTSVCLHVQNILSVSNGTPIMEEYTCDGDIPTNEDAAASNDDNERYTTPSKEANNMEIGLITGSPSSERGHDDIATDVSLAPTVQCINNAVSEAICSTPATVACLKNQGSREENQHIASNEKAAVDEEMTTLGFLDVQNTLSPILEEYTCDGDISTNEDAAASNDDNERYKTLSKAVNSVEIGLIAGSPSSERGHDDIATDVSLAPTVQCTNNAVSEAVDSTPVTDHKKTPVACLKNQGSGGRNQHRASNKKPVGQPKKEKFPHEKLQSATRSHGTRSPVSQVLWSPLTRAKAMSMSMSTPEALKLKRTRSGRVVVPPLNEGCQFIVYGRDGSITGVIGLDPPAMPKESELKTYYRRKKRRTESELKTYSRRKKRTE